MRRLLLQMAGLGLVAMVGPAFTYAASFGDAPKEVVKKKEVGCGSHGTSVEFVDTPREAAKIAKKEQKLVFVLHVSGNFEDPRFT